MDWLEPGVRADLIAGETFMHSPVNLKHATLLNFLERLLASYLEEIEDDGVLHRESVAIRLSARETFLPDLCYFTGTQARRLGLSHITFAPTFVVEALSPSTARRDLGPKFSAYELHGVQEYWVIDPDGLNHKFYRRAGDLLEEHSAKGDKIISAAIPGFWVKRSWLNPDSTPKVKDCVKAIMRSASRRR